MQGMGINECQMAGKEMRERLNVSIYIYIIGV